MKWYERKREKILRLVCENEIGVKYLQKMWYLGLSFELFADQTGALLLYSWFIMRTAGILISLLLKLHNLIASLMIICNQVKDDFFKQNLNT